MPTNPRLKADLAMVAVTALWGATFVVVKESLAQASVLVFMALRFGLAALVLAAMYWTAVRQMRRDEVRAGLNIGFFLFGGYAFQTTGLQYTTASKSALITGSAVVLVPVLMFLLWRHRVNHWTWLGATGAFAGLYLITVPPGEGLSGFAQLNRGDVLTMIGAVLFALHIIFIGRYSGKHSVGALTFVQVAVTALLALLAAPALHAGGWETVRLDWSLALGGALALTGIGGTAIAFSVQVWAQRYTSPAHIGVLLTLEPVFAAMTSFFVLGERLGGRALVGAALILAGILLAELKGPAQSAADAPGPVIETP
jgi:drug/metabolite transporter (DMT)-like permease